MLALIVSIIYLQLLHADSLSCRDDANNPVEWFVGYKFPDSFKYVYLTPGMDQWNVSEHLIHEAGMLKNTFNEIFRLKNLTDSSGFYGVYNDEKPGEPLLDAVPHTWGHLKGAVAFNQSSGVWIIHSIPKLSEAPDHYRYPPTGRIYGQHMLCVTLNSTHMLSIVEQLRVSSPNFLSTYVTADWAEQYPTIPSLLHNHSRNSAETNRTASFETLARHSLPLRHFSKSSRFGKDLYLDMVSPELGLGMKVETWRHGGSEPSVCVNGRPLVVNIQRVRFTHPAVAFSSFQDHSKWASTVPKEPSSKDEDDRMWICLGDINRMTSQFHRGGGTMCIRDRIIWNAFNSLIAEVEECSSNVTDQRSRMHWEL